MALCLDELVVCKTNFICLLQQFIIMRTKKKRCNFINLTRKKITYNNLQNLQDLRNHLQRNIGSICFQIHMDLTDHSLFVL